MEEQWIKKQKNMQMKKSDDMSMDDDMKMDDDTSEANTMMKKKSGNKAITMRCGAGRCGAGKCGGSK